MWLEIGSSATTAVVGIFLGIHLARKYLRNHRSHNLWWSVGLLLTGLAAFADLWATAAGAWNAPVFRLYWFCAGALVGCFGTGQMYLVGKRWGDLSAVVCNLINLWLLFGALTMPVSASALAANPALATHAPDLVKWPFILISSLGALLWFGGAAWSWWRTRATYIFLVVLSALLFSAAGTSAHYGGAALFYLQLAVASLVLYAGVALGDARQAVPQKVTRAASR